MDQEFWAHILALEHEQLEALEEQNASLAWGSSGHVQ